MQILCDSVLERVTVYARGAWVMRRLIWPESLPPGDCELVLEGFPLSAAGGSFRAAVEGGGRDLVSVQSHIQVPETDLLPSDSARRVADLGAAIARSQAEYDALQYHADLLGDLVLTPVLRPQQDPDAVLGRIEQAVATSTLLDDLLAEIHGRMLSLQESLTALRQDQADSRMHHEQLNSDQRMPTGHPQRRVTLLLSGSGEPGGITVTYSVPARWWPVYRINVLDGATRAVWQRDALVAQRSGEDWGQVHLRLSTADLIDDMTLPQLPSFRLGRAQQVVRRGFRPAPANLEQLFRSYDQLKPAPPPPPPPPPPPQPPPQQVPAGIAAPAAAPMMTRRARRTSETLDALPADEVRRQAKKAEPEARPAEPEGPPEPEDAWLDFDNLVMAGPETPRRGRLIQAPAPPPPTRLDDSLDALPDAFDPRMHRGAFDRLFESLAPVDVPSDGQPHRVSLESAESGTTVRWRTLPGMRAEVFRELELKNPFAKGLMPGTLDVLVEGTLLLSTSLTTSTGSGGAVHVGLGPEDRLRVARNVRMTEEKAIGILGDGVHLEYVVSIDLTSALGTPTPVEVVDRLPVTEDKTIKIKLLASSPEAQPYEQKDRDQPVRGGLRWLLSLPAGGRTSIEYRYRISFPGRSELAGGNRRE